MLMKISQHDGISAKIGAWEFVRAQDRPAAGPAEGRLLIIPCSLVLF